MIFPLNLFWDGFRRLLKEARLCVTDELAFPRIAASDELDDTVAVSTADESFPNIALRDELDATVAVAATDELSRLVSIATSDNPLVCA